MYVDNFSPFLGLRRSPNFLMDENSIKGISFVNKYKEVNHPLLKNVENVGYLRNCIRDSVYRTLNCHSVSLDYDYKNPDF